jgi:superfamily II DNA or RNA helicase
MSSRGVTERPRPESPSGTGRLSFSGGTLVLQGVSSQAIEKWMGPGIWVHDSRVHALRCDAMHYALVAGHLAGIHGGVDDVVPQWQRVHWTKSNIHELRPDQHDAFDAWMASPRGVIVMPTGTGKTEVALTIMRHTQVSTLVVAPVRDLMYQWHRRILGGLGYDAGIIGDNVHNVRPVSVTTYDSACIYMDRFGDRFGLIIFDECHHLPGDVRRDASRMCAAPMRLGLTATPERSDGRHIDLDSLIGPRLFEMSIAQAKGKMLADYDVVRIPIHLSDRERAKYSRLSRLIQEFIRDRRDKQAGYSWEDLCEETALDPAARRVLIAFQQKKAIEDRAAEKLRVLEDLFRLHAGSPIVVFAGSNAMAIEVSRRFLIPCLLNHCGKSERVEVLDGLQNGTYPALVANQVLDEGVDLPEVKVAIVIGGMASTKQAKQRLGRVLRKRGNARALLYEVVCTDTNEEQRSRNRRGSDAYARTRHRRI